MEYFKWNEVTLNDVSNQSIEDMYDRGFVMTRKGRGVMHQTRSLRIDLSQFELTSENRRILKKTQSICGPRAIELPTPSYDITIGKMAKDFYDNKFGTGVMSAQKIKEMTTDAANSNFNMLLAFDRTNEDGNSDKGIGYAITFFTPKIMHYSYPFYDLTSGESDIGLGMMIRAIEYASSLHLKYVYLGSLQRPTDTYKLQFKGLQWFDGQKWSSDMKLAKLEIS